jgi:hypothetical protein
MFMWKDFIQELSVDCDFRSAALEIDIASAETSLNLKFPNSLKSFLLETNGLYSRLAFLMLVWSADEILKRNLKIRSNEEYAQTYMSFQNLLFFADAGVDGIMFAYRITASGIAQDKNIIAWYPIEDSRPVIAISLEDYLKHCLSGKLKL